MMYKFVLQFLLQLHLNLRVKYKCLSDDCDKLTAVRFM
jgi:hypothetical protein